MEWPEGFLWGTGASSTQCEGAAPASDWIDWERQGRAPVSGEGNGFAHRYREDFAIYASLGLTHHRLSIEWARRPRRVGDGHRGHPTRVRRSRGAAEGDGRSRGVDLRAVDGRASRRRGGHAAAGAAHPRRELGRGPGAVPGRVLQVPGRDPIERPDLAGSFDLIGFSYYAAIGVRDGGIVPHPLDAPRSPLGYGIWADGLGRVLDRLHAEVPGTPLLIAEYGLGTDDDDQRAAYLRRGLEVTASAIERGIDVRGLFHWTGVDNYEWLHGYDVAFGIVDRDRRVRSSAEVLRAAATSGRTPDAPG